MYRSITVAVDNSPQSEYAERIALQIARPDLVPVNGVHAYTGKFHEARFRALEAHLPEQYQNEEALGHQRDIHSVLIGRGLELISLEYLKRLGDACTAAGVPFTATIVDGKNADVVIGAGGARTLTVMGAEGLGHGGGVDGLGSTTRRTLRHGKGDLLIAKNAGPIRSILAGIDGSPESFAMVGQASSLAQYLGAGLIIAAGFDPRLHRTVFTSLATTLSQEAGAAFRFSEQEGLHNSIIDRSLADLYSRHLEQAAGIALQHNVRASTRLAQGKPFQVLCTLAEETGADLVVVGHSGLHRSRFSDIGSTTERVAELAPVNVLVVRSKLAGMPAVGEPPATDLPGAGNNVLTNDLPALVWSDDARKRLENVPKFARPMAVMAIERYAREQRILTITPEVMASAREKMGK